MGHVTVFTKPKLEGAQQRRKSRSCRLNASSHPVQTTTNFSQDRLLPLAPSLARQSQSMVPPQPTGDAARPHGGSIGSIEPGLLSPEYCGSVNGSVQGNKKSLTGVGVIFVSTSVWILI